MKVYRINIDEKEDIGITLYKNCLSFCNKAKTLLDVGCGQGGHSLMASKLGFKVTAIDGRIDRIPFDKFKENSIQFTQSLIEEIENFDYDIILLSDIFYHLDLLQQINLLNKISKSKFKYIILNTHIYNISAWSQFENWFKDYIVLGEIKGKIYCEGINRENRTAASISNYYSFWHTFRSLIYFLTFYLKIKKVLLLEPGISKNRFYFFGEK